MSRKEEETPGAATPREASPLAGRADLWRFKAETAARKADKYASAAASASRKAVENGKKVIECLKALP